MDQQNTIYAFRCPSCACENAVRLVSQSARIVYLETSERNEEGNMCLEERGSGFSITCCECRRVWYSAKMPLIKALSGSSCIRLTSRAISLRRCPCRRMSEGDGHVRNRRCRPLHQLLLDRDGLSWRKSMSQLLQAWKSSPAAPRDERSCSLDGGLQRIRRRK